jgi:prepilin peptidase CpaA
MAETLTALLPLAAVLLLALVAAHDLAARTIPDRANLALLACGLALRAADGTLLPWGLVAALAVFGLGFLAWRAGAMGGGDVKLLAAVALLVPPAAVPSLLLAVALAGGLLAATYLLAHRLARPAPAGPRPQGLLARAARAEAWRISRRGPLPYGVAIAAGAVFALFHPGLA